MNDNCLKNTAINPRAPVFRTKRKQSWHHGNLTADLSKMQCAYFSFLLFLFSIEQSWEPPLVGEETSAHIYTTKWQIKSFKYSVPHKSTLCERSIQICLYRYYKYIFNCFISIMSTYIYSSCCLYICLVYYPLIYYTC